MTRATVKNGEFVFPSPYTKARFLKLAEGKEVFLELREKPTDEMRRYFEGCLVPAFYYFHPRSGWRTFADARDVLKLEFAPGTKTLRNPVSKEFYRVAPSTSDMGKKRFGMFVESIVAWMIENGMPSDVLESEEYKRWRDTNFDEDIYPPLKRLKESYDRQRSYIRE